jgi:hypothetical protein
MNFAVAALWRDCAKIYYLYWYREYTLQSFTMSNVPYT